MNDFTIKVSAETQDAVRNLDSVQKAADAATKARSIKIEIPNYSQLSKNFSDLRSDVDSAVKSIRQLYSVASKLPVGPIDTINDLASNIKKVGVVANESRGRVADAGAVISGSLQLAEKAAESLVGKLVRISFGLYAISEAAKVAQAAFGGLFNETIGREVQLRETILKTQTTLASTNKVFKGNKEITDPYEKIVSLTGQVSERIDSIRERAIALAGVTSNDVIEVFGIVASQVGQIGGGLKEAEDLAINFAAALGTFGIPLYQARQEIGSILRGDITMDSYLAKSLGITNEDIARAKSEAGGVVKFLEDRLAAAVAGQRIAAEGFAGVVSNIKDLSELINQNFGRGLLDPLIDGLTRVFDFLFSIRKELFSIASKAGASVGTLLSLGLGKTLGASGGFQRSEVERTGPTGSRGVRRGAVGETVITRTGATAESVMKGIEAAIDRITLEIERALSTVYLQLATLTERAANAFTSISKGLAALAMGLLSLKLEQLKATIGALEAISPALLAATNAASGFLAAWGGILQLPLVQQFTQLTANMRLLEVSGIMPLIKNGFVLRGVLENWGKVSQFVATQFTRLRAIIGGFIAFLGTLAVAVNTAGQRMLAAWQPQSVALHALKAELQTIIVQLGHVGVAAQAAGNKIGSLGKDTKVAGGGVVGLIAGFVKFNLLMLAIEATLGLVLERYSAWKEGQDKIASDKRAEEALRRLNTTYKNIGESASASTKRARDFERALVDARYDDAIRRLTEVQKKLEEIQDLRSGQNIDSGDQGRRFLQFLNPANWNIGQRQGEPLADAVYRSWKEKEALIQQDIEKWGQAVDLNEAAENVRVAADNRINLEKEINDLRRSQEDALFQRRQEAARKEIEAFRLAGELRIFQMEQANQKLLEGEEGASRAAIEALNNYLSIKEKGELEIEASKQELVLELQNLEKSVADYRYQQELKIAEIRKKSAQYDQEVADYNAQVALQAATNPQVGPAVFGDIAGRTGGDQSDASRGNSSGAHLHAQSAMGQEALIAFLNKALVFPNGMKLGGPGGYPIGDDYAAHAARRSGGIDFGVPGNTPFSLAPGYTSRNLGIRGNLGLGMEIIGPNGERATLGHLRAASTQTGAAAAQRGPQSTQVDTPNAPPARPLPPNFDSLNSASDQNAAIVQGTKNATVLITNLRQALTEARTLAAFGDISKAILPAEPVEQYRDAIIATRFQLEAFEGVAANAYDPEKLNITVEAGTKLAIKQREINELLADAKTKLSVEEYARLEQDIAERKKNFMHSLNEERKLRGDLLVLARKQAAVEALIERTRDKRFETQAAGLDAIGSMADSYSEDPATRRRAAAELEIARERLRLEKERQPIEGETLKRLQEFAAAARASAEVLGQLDKAVIEFQRSMELIRGAAATIAGSQRDFLKAIITGGDVTEAMNAMLENMTSKFLDMFLEAATKPFENYLTEQMKGLFNIQDPTKQLQIENNTNLAANTAALAANTAALQGSGATGPGGAQTLPQIGPTPPLETLPDTGQPVSTEQLQGQLDTTTQTIATVNTELPELGKATTDATKNMQGVATKAGESQSAFDGLMKNMGGAMVALGGLAMGFAGAQQMQKGGTYNTLMGLAGIFGAVGSFTGGLGSMFGGAAGSATQGAGALGNASGGISPSSMAAIDKYSVPLPGDVSIKSFAGGGYTGAGAATGGLDGRGGFMAMLHPNETITPGSPYAATAASIETFSNRQMRESSGGPIKVETSVINNVEYATLDQLQEATRQAEDRGARRGRSMTLNDLQNSVRARKRVGIN